MKYLLNRPGVYIFAIVVGIAAVAWGLMRDDNRLTWSMIHVSGERFSGDAHLLEFPDGQVALIDTGFNRFTKDSLIPYLDHRDIDHIDHLIISHAHRNHYGGIESLLKHSRKIGNVYFNVPPKQPCDRENWSTGCDFEHVRETRKLIDQSTPILRELETGQVIYADPERPITLSVVFVHDGESEPIGNTDINDTSAVLRLTYGSQSVLFPGDLNTWVGNYLVDENYDLKANILTAPHHGVEGAASNAFLDKVNASVMMVSNSAGHWLGERGTRMRNYSSENNMDVFVTGIDGNVVTRLTGDGYDIDTQLKN